MPIRAENKGRYPKDWPQISKAKRDAAGQCCEKCKAPNGQWIRRGKTEDGQHVWRLSTDSVYMDGVCADTGLLVPDTDEDIVGYGRVVKVVLTVAHLDHQPENCHLDNLRAWCQRCHNVYDAPMRARGVAERRKSKLAVGDIFNA
jgi:hypothetical protein